MILSVLHSTRSGLILSEALLRMQMILHLHLLFLASQLPVELRQIQNHRQQYILVAFVLYIT